MCSHDHRSHLMRTKVWFLLTEYKLSHKELPRSISSLSLSLSGSFGIFCESKLIKERINEPNNFVSGFFFSKLYKALRSISVWLSKLYSLFLHYPGKRRMAECNTKTSDTSFNTHGVSVQPSSSIKHIENYHFGKALAYRAVYGSSVSGTQGSGSRKARGSDARTSPSRLSKVLVAIDNSDN